MATKIKQLQKLGDSIGGICTGVILKAPVGLGEPVFDKLEAELAKAMMSLPATKGFEIGEGFGCVEMTGSSHNDMFAGSTIASDGSEILYTESNRAGGTLGGISTGNYLVFRVAIKAASSIGLPQKSCSFKGNVEDVKVKGRHDPCVLPRASPLIEGMAALVIADSTLRQRARVGPKPLMVVDYEKLA
eukprot:GHVL01034627.1.p1 GENE.GHVL01034627.1~~GHVL01034627.1.p1  ORF type:complete len:188 (+),score=33.11 GHVL01034627.1:777-1340(+)